MHFNRHFPDNLQIHGEGTHIRTAIITVFPPRRSDSRILEVGPVALTGATPPTRNNAHPQLHLTAKAPSGPTRAYPAAFTFIRLFIAAIAAST